MQQLYDYTNNINQLIPGPANVEMPMLSLVITTMFPGPLADASGLLRGTTTGLTYTAKVPSVFLDAVPTSFIVDFKIPAYSKSTAVSLEIPTVGTVSQGTVLPKQSFASRLIFACTSCPCQNTRRFVTAGHT